MREPIIIYDYVDLDGNLLYQNCRYEPKDFRQRRPDGNGGYLWNLKDTKRILYRLPELRKAIEGRESLIFCCEGERDVDNLWSYGLPATTSGSASSWRPELIEYLQRAILVCILPDNDESGHNYAKQVATTCTDSNIPVKILELPGLLEKQDVSDWLAAGGTKDQLLKLVEGLPFTSSNRANKQTASEQLANFIISISSLFHDQKRTTFITTPSGTFEIGSEDCRRWVINHCIESGKTVPATQTINDAMAILDAKAAISSPCIEPSLRVAHLPNMIIIDLCNKERQAVKVTPNNWEIIPLAEIPQLHFLQQQGMHQLPIPIRGGCLENDLRPLINANDDHNWELIKVALISAFWRGPYIILVVEGEPGSGKSWLCTMLRQLIDPSAVPRAMAPSNTRDLAITCANSYCLSFDNVSSLSNEISDAHCGVSTGSGFRARKLYRNKTEVLLRYCRPQFFNGIGSYATRSDFLSRTIVLRLPQLKNRRTEHELQQEFEEKHGHIFGAILDVLSAGLKNLPNVVMNTNFRMLDSIEFAMATAPALGMIQADIVNVCTTNHLETSEAAVESDTFAGALLRMLEQQPGKNWTGKLAELVPEFLKILELRNVPRDWPSTPRGIRSRLDRLADPLRQQGVIFKKLTKGNRTQEWLIEMNPPNIENIPETTTLKTLYTGGLDELESGPP